MMAKYTPFLALLLCLAAETTQALIDTKNANYAESWIDMFVPSSGYDLKVQRGYNSRTLYNGMFGFGMCFDFETSLSVTPEGNIKYTDCGAGEEVNYIAKGYSEKDVEKTVKQIIEKVKAEGINNSPSVLNDLENKLRTDVALRGEYANKYGIVRVIADKTKYYANGRESDFIEKQGQYYVRIIPEGGSQKFKLNGKLEKIFDRNGNALTLTYEGKNLKDITDEAGRKLTFSYYENGKVKTVSGPGTFKAEYKYKNLNDLIYVKMAKGGVITYDYDDLHNMVRVNLPDKTYKQITYDKNKDWVIGFRDSDGCTEKYDYVLSTEDPKNHFWVNIVRKCKEKVVVQAKYEFWYELKSDKSGSFLKKSKTQENSNLTEVTYNDLGRPLNVNRNGKITKYEFYDFGLLKKKVTPEGISTYVKYDNPFRKVSRVERAGKVTEYFYDNKGNMNRITNSDGLKVVMNYDNRGRLINIEDQARRKISLKWDEKFGKPIYLEREGLGAISLSYNSQGEAVKVISGSGGAVVSKQILSTFASLVELTQPSGIAITL